MSKRDDRDADKVVSTDARERHRLEEATEKYLELLEKTFEDQCLELWRRRNMDTVDIAKALGAVEAAVERAIHRGQDGQGRKNHENPSF
jgi:hypothetical protein